MIRKFLVMALVAVTTALVAPATSQAAFTLTLTQGVDSLSLELPTTAGSDAGTVGTTAYSYSGYQYDATTQTFVFGDLTFGEYRLLPGFTSNINGGTNLPGGPIASLLLSSLGVERVLVGPAQTDLNAPVFSLTLVADGFTAPVGIVALRTTFTGQFNNTAAQGTATLTSTVTGLGTNLQAIATGTTPVGVTQNSSPFNAVSGYAITHKVELTNMAVGANDVFNQGTIDSSVAIATPAPAGLLLAAFGIPAFGLLRRFGRKSGAAQVAV